MRRALAVLSAVCLSIPALLSACGGDAPPPVAPPAPSGSASAVATTAKTETPAQVGGVEREALDNTTSPCDDFYQYACGGWIKNTQLPADEATWTRSFSVIHDRNEEILHGILEAKTKDPGDDPYGKQIGDLYASCMDEDGIEKAGLKPLEPWLKAIDDVKDPTSLTRLIGRFQNEGLMLLFGVDSQQDFGDATKVIGSLRQGGLGMPERDYYLNDKSQKMVEIRGIYEKHVAAMLTLAGDPEAKAAAEAKTVMAVETQLARASMTKEDMREPKKLNHRAAKADLGKLAPGLAWDTWLDASNAKTVAQWNVSQPEFFKSLGTLVNGKISVNDWKVYYRWQLLHSAAPELPKKFVDENFKWRQQLTGQQTIPVRWKRCVRAVDGAMGEALAQPFVKKTLGSEGKANVVGLVQNIEDAMKENITGISWMDDPTRKAAFAKLGKLANKIAYPDKFRNYDSLTITRDSYFANAVAAAGFEHKREMTKIGKPVDRTEWGMSPPTVNAYYDPQLNEMVFPAGILQPPFYANSQSAATNYGGIGMVMGHELTHGFDDEGRQFDGDGNLKDWWGPSVNTEFEHRADCVKKQYDDFVVLGDVHINGKLTLGENIADLGGVKLGLKAMKAKAAAAPTTAKEFTPEQEFFLGFAQVWCTKQRDEALRHQVATNPHSPARFRVNGPISNIPEFAQAFSCKPDAKMVKKDRCEVW